MSAARLNDAAKVLRARVSPQLVCDHYCAGCRQNAIDAALADWLDAQAKTWQEDWSDSDVERKSLTVADAILGGAW